MLPLNLCIYTVSLDHSDVVYFAVECASLIECICLGGLLASNHAPFASSLCVVQMLRCSA